jgi:hypothetical protein
MKKTRAGCVSNPCYWDTESLIPERGGQRFRLTGFHRQKHLQAKDQCLERKLRHDTAMIGTVR